uniref:Uncharacterized protein n=1 Tax=Panagrolaimus sp. PS1159 TaxID=55785 RepID=A0AC35G1G0_9BILA
MMKTRVLEFLIFSIFALSVVRCQSCSSPHETKQVFGTYLNCLKHNVDNNYLELEDEIRSDNRKAAAACFAPTIAEANAKDRCVLALTDLDSKAWDRNGPLRDCSICRTFASSAIKALLSTPEEDQKCIRHQISNSIAKEAEYCLRKKLSDFAGVPEIPDLEEGSFNAKESVINSISDYILINSRLTFCSERKPKRAITTKKCLANPFSAATCECINEARSDLKSRISGIAEAIQEAITNSRGGAPAIGGSGSKVDACVANIKRQL